MVCGLFNIVTAAIEKLLTFSEETQKDLSPPLPQGITFQAAVQEDASADNIKPVEKGSHTTHQHQWMNLPPLRLAKQDSLNETPMISPSPHWVYPYPYSLYGPPMQSVATSNKSQVIPSPSTGDNSGVTIPAHPVQPVQPVQPVVKQWPRQQQTLSTHCSSHQQG